jgi:hypothetical protein
MLRLALLAAPDGAENERGLLVVDDGRERIRFDVILKAAAWEFFPAEDEQRENDIMALHARNVLGLERGRIRRTGCLAAVSILC